MAEGFIQNNTSSKLPEDLGMEYHGELVSRNLLEPRDAFHGQSVCTMHDLVRDFAQLVAKDEGLFVSEGESSSTSLANRKLRHLSISRDATELGSLETEASLRTLMLFNRPVTYGYLDNLRCLRVLHISCNDVNLMEFPEYVCQLKHLRYLLLRGTSISKIPEGIGDLKFLQAIDLVGSINLCQLPESILKLQNLRCISLYGTKITSIPRGFGKLKNLVNLQGITTHSDYSGDGWCSLEELGSLLKLKYLYITCLDKAPSGSVAARAKLSSKQHLIWLQLIFTSDFTVNWEVQDPPPSIG